MNLAAAFGSLVGVGAATLISVKLGQKDYDTAQRVLGNVFVLNLIIGISFTVIVLPFLDPILYFFGGSDETVKYAREFMQVILLGNSHRTYPVTDKNTIYHIVKRRRRHGDNCRNGILH